MRDINAYTEVYCVSDFEQLYQVYYRRKKILELFNGKKYDKILEIGCGMQSIGPFLDFFKEFTVVEPGSKFIEKAKKDLAGREEPRFFQGLLEEKLDVLKNYRYDLIIVSSLIHEVEKPAELLLAIKSLCSENTTVHINAPNEYSMHRILAYESGIIKKIDSMSERNTQLQQSYVYNLRTLEQEIRNSGDVTIIDRGSYFVKPFSHVQMEKCLEYGIFNEQTLEGFYNMIKYMPDLGSEIYMNYRYTENGSKKNEVKD